MSGSEAIIKKIIDDANLHKKDVLNSAKAEAESISAKAEKDSSAYFSRQTDEIAKEAALVIERKNTVATLDGRKILLRAKKELIDTAFSKAEEKILSLSKGEYLNFVSKLIADNAEERDVVIIGKDEKHIDEAFVLEMCKKLKINLTLSKEREDFLGGIILKSTYLNKNLTLKSIVRVLAEELDGEIAKILFE